MQQVILVQPRGRNETINHRRAGATGAIRNWQRAMRAVLSGAAAHKRRVQPWQGGGETSGASLARSKCSSYIKAIIIAELGKEHNGRELD